MPYCDRCHQTYLSSDIGHECPPRWTVRCDGHATEEVSAYSDEEAAQIYAEEFDWDDAYGDDSIEVMVSRHGARWERYRVTRVVSYDVDKVS